MLLMLFLRVLCFSLILIKVFNEAGAETLMIVFAVETDYSEEMLKQLSTDAFKVHEETD